MLLKNAMQTRAVTIGAQKTLLRAVTMMQAEAGVHPRREVSDRLGYRPCPVTSSPVTSSPVISNPVTNSLDASQPLCRKRLLETGFSLEAR